jgi:hypothetical protein
VPVRRIDEDQLASAVVLMPVMRLRVVWGLVETMAIFAHQGIQ